MMVLRLLALTLIVGGVTACGVPQPGDPDYEKYQQSKTDRADRMFEGLI